MNESVFEEEGEKIEREDICGKKVVYFFVRHLHLAVGKSESEIAFSFSISVCTSTSANLRPSTQGREV